MVTHEGKRRALARMKDGLCVCNCEQAGSGSRADAWRRVALPSYQWVWTESPKVSTLWWCSQKGIKTGKNLSTCFVKHLLRHGWTGLPLRKNDKLCHNLPMRPNQQRWRQVKNKTATMCQQKSQSIVKYTWFVLNWSERTQMFLLSYKTGLDVAIKLLDLRGFQHFLIFYKHHWEVSQSH